MRKDTRTSEKILPSSLCKRVNLTVPTGWEELTQQQLRHVLNLLFVFGEVPAGLEKASLMALQYFGKFRVERDTADGTLCVLKNGDTFLMAHSIVPDLLKSLEWMAHPEDMTVRIEKIGKFEATDFLLQGFPFGNYMKVENYYQAYLDTKDGQYLELMGRLLYDVPDNESFPFGGYLPLSVLLWFTAVKKRFATQFPHFLKPKGTGQSAAMSQYEMVAAQIRLLTKGDVSKNEQILNVTTWDALCELDALARESEELKKSYGKKHV